ncbi:polysaccharide deacetylase family protein [Kitasatospora aburaviensis]
MVALTFDDGPHPEHTPRILEVLRRHDAPAAFFCIGLHALAYSGVVRRIADEGHTLGNHTWSHAYLPDLGPIELHRQLSFTAEAIAAAAGAARCRGSGPRTAGAAPNSWSGWRSRG